MLPKYDAVHAHWLIPQGIVQSFFKKPYIVTGHGGDVTSLNKGIIRKLKVRCLKKAGRVTVVSEPLKRKVQELAPGVKVNVISMGVDTSKFSPQYREDDYFGSASQKTVLFVGRLAEKKGVTYLIEAMKDVDARLVIAGDGPLKASLKKQAAQLGKGKVQFYGSKTHEELKKIYASADVLCAPSVTAGDGDTEGLPTVIMEAMASGLPVVASNSGGISGVVKDGENGILCEEKNVRQLEAALNRVLTNCDLREKLIKNELMSAELLDYSNLAKQYKEELRKVIQ
jgi:glycosyltransferase involved in cell wall biosynthesis